ncbi:MAG TPA: hypothetical protein VKB50_33125 [Vicinamibacterales bacterium]|nr:hypothetical protein [Vicinamibacterales bacterium]
MKPDVMRARVGAWSLIAATVVAVSIGSPAWGQGLGAVAKETEAKRKALKASGKVYTNDSLKPDPSPSPAPAAPPPIPPSGAGDSKTKQPDGAKDEAAWRDRIKIERDALARAGIFAAALQSQINGLYGEFTACQAPPQCSEISARRQKSIGELDRVKKEVEQHQKAIADIQEEARKAGVPAGWVR